MLFRDYVQRDGGVKLKGTSAIDLKLQVSRHVGRDFEIRCLAACDTSRARPHSSLLLRQCEAVFRDGAPRQH